MTWSGEVKPVTLHHLGQRPFRGIQVGLLAVIACAIVQPAGASSSDRRRILQGRDEVVPRIVHPTPIQAALNLLRWSPDHVPMIEVVDVRPPQVNILAEGWIVTNADGSAQPTIYVAGWSKLYREALVNPFLAHNIIRLAGVLAHERVHILHGPDEELAYAEQLITLERLQAPELERTNVRRALEAVKRRQRGRS